MGSLRLSGWTRRRKLFSLLLTALSSVIAMLDAIQVAARALNMRNLEFPVCLSKELVEREQRN